MEQGGMRSLLDDILVEVLFAIMLIIFTAAVAYPRNEPVIKPETDYYICQKFPCFTEPYRVEWVSRKYLTKSAKRGKY